MLPQLCSPVPAGISSWELTQMPSRAWKGRSGCSDQGSQNQPKAFKFGTKTLPPLCSVVQSRSTGHLQPTDCQSVTAALKRSDSCLLYNQIPKLPYTRTKDSWSIYTIVLNTLIFLEWDSQLPQIINWAGTSQEQELEMSLFILKNIQAWPFPSLWGNPVGSQGGFLECRCSPLSYRQLDRLITNHLENRKRKPARQRQTTFVRTSDCTQKRPALGRAAWTLTCHAKPSLTIPTPENTEPKWWKHGLRALVHSLGARNSACWLSANFAGSFTLTSPPPQSFHSNGPPGRGSASFGPNT